MQAKKFSVFEAIVYGLKTTLDHFRLFFLTTVTFGATVFGAFAIIALSLGIIGFGKLIEISKTLTICDGSSCTIRTIVEAINGAPLGIAIVSTLVLWIFIIGLSIGYIRIMLDQYDTGTSQVKRLFSCFGLVPKFTITTILFGLIVFLGTLVLIIPGIILAARLGLFAYFIVDKNTSIIGSVKKSYAATKGATWPIVCLMAVMMSLQTIGGLNPLLIFVILAPANSLSYAYVYRKLTS